MLTFLGRPITIPPMPTYDYLCEGCGTSFEAFLRSRSAKASCPECHSNKLKKQITGFRMNLGAQPEGPPMGGTCGCGAGG